MASNDFKRYICVKFNGYCYTNDGAKPRMLNQKIFRPSPNYIDSDGKLKGGFYPEVQTHIWKFNEDWFAVLDDVDIDTFDPTLEIPGAIYAQIWNAIEGIIQMGIVSLGNVTPIGCNLKAVYDEDTDTVTFEGDGTPCGYFVNHLKGLQNDFITTFEIYTEASTINYLWPDEGE